MDFTDGLRGWANWPGYWFRRYFRTSRKLSVLPAVERLFQEELETFLSKFDWSKMPRGPITALDVGTKNFAVGPVLDKLLNQNTADIHGIELDGYRLLRGFYSRASFGHFFAQKMRSGHFHVMDFLDWKQPVELITMLNPFLSANPLLSWGLPLSELKPEKMFLHAFHCLEKKGGVLIVSCPTQDEFEIACRLAKEVGFTLSEQKRWDPTPASIQKMPRFGAWFTTN